MASTQASPAPAAATTAATTSPPTTNPAATLAPGPHPHTHVHHHSPHPSHSSLHPSQHPSQHLSQQGHPGGAQAQGHLGGNALPPSPPRPPSPSGTQTNEALAALLATAYKDIAGLKDQLVQATRRAEVAERVARSLPSGPGSTNGTGSASGAATAGASGGGGGGGTSGAGNGTGNGGPGPRTQDTLTHDLISRVATLELQLESVQGQLVGERERRSQIWGHWVGVEEYLAGLERAAGETRRGFGGALHGEVIGSVGGVAGQGSPVDGYTTGQRRSHRELDDAHGPPSKRSKGNDGRGRGVYGDATFHDPTSLGLPRLHPPALQHRVIAAPGSSSVGVGSGSALGPPTLGKHHRSPSRASSHSSVDDMLMDTVGGDERRAGAALNGVLPSQSSGVVPTTTTGGGHSRKKGSGGSVRDGSVGGYGGAYEGGGGLAYPASQSVPRGGAFQQTYQTHQFVTPVTGAPIKKSKYSVGAGGVGGVGGQGGGGLGDSPSTNLVPGAATGPLFPATNEQGQRICRQCGQPGRYKDGKCVEKWGPGPAGPGTVCDRCRKKMKRVERRGTLESQQLAAQAQLVAQASLATMHQSQSQSLHEGSSRALHRTDTIPVNASSGASPAGKAGEKGGEKGSVVSAPPPKVSHVRTLMSNSVTSSGKDNRHSPLPPHLQHSSNNNSSSSNNSLPSQNQQHSLSPEQQQLLQQASHSLQERARQELQQQSKTGTEKERATGMGKTMMSKGANGNGNGNGVNGNGNGKAGGEGSGIDVTDSDADGDAEAEGEVENEIVMTLGAASSTSSRQRTEEEEEEEEDSVEEQTQLIGDGEDELDGEGEGDMDMEGDGEGEVEDDLLDAVEAAAGHR